ncbi:MAG TPA: hypothetical protein VIM62_02800, partial [Acidobacteriaceae bacterium]
MPRFSFSTLRITLLFVLIVLLTLASPAQSTASIYGPHGISPLAVRQGVLGSCYFHAALAAVAQANPEALRLAIHGNPTSGFRVHFVSGPDELVYSEDIAYARAHNYDKSEGEWVTILMRAFAQRKLRQGMIAAVEKSTVVPAFLKPTALSELQNSGPLLVAYDRAIRSVINQDGQIDRARFQANLAQELAALGIGEARAKTIEGLLDHAGFYEELNNTVKENGEVFGAYRGMSAGGIPRSVISAFLGSADAARVTSPLLVEQLAALHNGGKAIVAGSRNVPPFTDKAPDWYIPGHAYT